MTCRIQESSGTDALDKKTCEIALARGRFQPATDSKGQPTASEYPISIRWQIPNDGPPPAIDVTQAPPPDFRMERTVTFGADGTVLACKSPTIDWQGHRMDPCAEIKVGTETARRWQRDGRAVGATITQTSTEHTSVDP